jgi:hypothetical protein
VILLISASQAARIIGVNHHAQLRNLYFNKLVNKAMDPSCVGVTVIVRKFFLGL